MPDARAALKTLERAGRLAAVKALTEDERLAEWEAIEQMRGRWYPGTRRRLREIMRAQERDVLEAIDRAGAPEAKALTIEEVRQIILAYIAEWIAAVNNSMPPWIEQIIRDGEAAGAARVLGILEQAGIVPPVTIPLDYGALARQVLRSTLVNEETGRLVIERVQSSLLEGRTLVQMRRDIRKLFVDMRSYRVDRITNTVVVGAFEAGTLSSWQATGITGKSWISARDERVREDHDTRAHPELTRVIPLEQSFVVGGAPLLFPGDPEGPASQIINCRCTMAPHME